MPKLKDVLTVSASTKPLYGEQFWLLNLDMVEQQTGNVLEYNYVDKSQLNGSIIQFDTNTVLYSKLRPNLNKVVLPLYDGFATSEMLPLKPDTTKLLKEYLAVFLRSDSFVVWATSKTAGAKMPRLGTSELLSKEIPLPSIDDQRYISDLFNNINCLIILRKQQLSKLDELVKSRFIELFGDPITNPMRWKKKSFDSLCENLDYRRKPITASERQAGIYPYYGASGIVDYVADYIFDENILLVSEDGANLLMRSTPIAFSVSGKVWVNNHAHVVKFEKMSMQKYIEVFFSLINISDYITGSAQPKLNQAKLNSMMFPVPTEERLEKFLKFIEQVDKSKSEIQKSLEKLETLKKALMQKYFG